MKLLIIGCGSIGKRHVANAKKYSEVGVYDSAESVRDYYKNSDSVTIFSGLEAALAWKPNGAIIATPPDGHIKIAKFCVDANIPVLIEKPISNQFSDAEEFLKIAKEKKSKVFVVCNMRFHSAISTLEKYLPRIGRPLFTRAYYGNYLPNMRPKQDYRQLYAASSEKGGGVVLDAIHEIDYLRWLLGDVISVMAATAQLGDLEINVEDYASIMMLHRSGVRSEIHLDFLQQVKRRGCEIVGTDGTLIWQSEGKNPEICTVRLYSKSLAKWETIYHDDNEDLNSAYDILVQRFIHSLDEDDSMLASGQDGLADLVIALAALKSAKYNQPVDLVCEVQNERLEI